jgi:glucose-6-phosphate isomerase
MTTPSWQTFQSQYTPLESIGMALDLSRMLMPGHLPDADPAIVDALNALARLESGHKANVDEDRMVGHYWLRDEKLAPTPEISAAISGAIQDVKAFVHRVHTGEIMPQKADGFFIVLVVGIGGSALGPQLLCDSLGKTDDAMLVRFLDNTDPAGIDRVLDELDENIAGTLTVVTSKSGGTKETRNSMREVAARYEAAGLAFAKHAVAVTSSGSELDGLAEREQWLARFPMWDFVGGRTSVTSAVGLLPAALIGIDIMEVLAGAREVDAITRSPSVRANPAALLALAWHNAAVGRGKRNMVVMPYCDRLGLLARYLQQLVMESIGKESDRDGKPAHEGITVYGNKGSTDQHAFVQQLREGPNDFFLNFVEVLQKRSGKSMEVEPGTTSGDYLHGFLYGTRDALWERERESLTVTLDEVSPRRVGGLIALYERAVGLYAELVNVNAYHQPGVEAGKKCAQGLLALQSDVMAWLRSYMRPATATKIAEGMNQPDAAESIFHVLNHLAANGDHGITVARAGRPDVREFAAASVPRKLSGCHRASRGARRGLNHSP